MWLLLTQPFPTFDGFSHKHLNNRRIIESGEGLTSRGEISIFKGSYANVGELSKGEIPENIAHMCKASCKSMSLLQTPHGSSSSFTTA